MCRDCIRAITTSLPVSPCSSPLRQYRPAQGSFVLSPPHSAYATRGQGGYNLNEYSSYTTTRPNTTYAVEPWQEISSYRTHTPGGSPRTRPIWIRKYQQKHMPSLPRMFHKVEPHFCIERILYSCSLISFWLFGSSIWFSLSDRIL